MAPAVDRAAEIRAGPPVPVGQVWILEQAGPSPTDTSVTFLASEGRRIMIRHGAPDNAVYAIIDIPAAAIAPTRGDSAIVTVAPLPGRFGLDITSPGAIGPGVVVTFSYATHFRQPSDADARYASATRFEQSMGAARLDGASTVDFIDSQRPAADMMRFSLPAAGTFVLAAPR